MRLNSRFLQSPWFIISVACFISLGFTVSEQFPFIGEVTTAKLNVRILPKVSREATIVKIINMGTEVEVVGEENGFYKIAAPKGTFAWIHERNVQKVSDSELKVLQNNTPLRADSRINAQQLTVARQGQALQYSKYYLGWYRISPTDDVHFFVSAKYIRKTKEFTKAVNTTNTNIKESKAALCKAKLQEAEYLIQKQHQLIKDNKIKDVSFEEIIMAYESAAEYADDPSTKRFAEENARRYKEMRNLMIGLKANVSALESQSQKAQELLSALDKLNQTKTYTYTGILDTVGLIPDRPAAFKLVSDERTKCYVKFNANEDMKLAERLYKKEVGVIGTVVFTDTSGDIPVIIVDLIEQVTTEQTIEDTIEN